MYQVEVVYDETNSTLRWLRVSHNGASWSSVQVRSNEEALQIITALQQSVQADGSTVSQTFYGSVDTVLDGTQSDKTRRR